MTSLPELLLAPDVQPRVVADCQKLVEQELSSKGIAATPLKVAYKAVTAFAPGYYQQTIEAMLPHIVEALEPFWADFSASGSAEFGDYLAKRPTEVSEALLTVTDNMAAASERARSSRPTRRCGKGAGKTIEAALPNLGAMVQSYA